MCVLSFAVRGCDCSASLVKVRKVALSTLQQATSTCGLQPVTTSLAESTAMGSVANAFSPFMSQPQKSVDMLGDLPDIDFFSIPGDRSVSMEHRLCYFCTCRHGGNLPRVLSCSTICLFWSAVDDFYEDYVTELGSRNSRKLSGGFPL